MMAQRELRRLLVTCQQVLKDGLRPAEEVIMTRAVRLFEKAADAVDDSGDLSEPVMRAGITPSLKIEALPRRSRSNRRQNPPSS